MWKSQLESVEDESEKPLIVSLNAWESDYYGDPLFAIISSLVDTLPKDGSSAASLISAAKDVGWFATAISGQVVKKLTGIDAVAAGDVAEKKRAKRNGSEDVSSDAFSIYQGRKAAMCDLQKAIKEFVDQTEPRVMFLVDELDRCRPDYAISYLETIKHIFDVPGAVFILAADRQQLENSAKTAFGADLDFEEYYRKFIHREVTLPPISDSGYSKLAQKYVPFYLERDGPRKCFMEIERARRDNIVELAAALRLTPRQIQEVFRILGHLFETTNETNEHLRWVFAVGSIAMAAFKVGMPKVFDLLGSSRFDPNEALSFLRGLVGSGHASWWFELFLTGGGLKRDENESFQDVLSNVGLIRDPHEARHENLLDRWDSNWGYMSDGKQFATIHEKIEQISQFT
jgi:hypothetical protein